MVRTGLIAIACILCLVIPVVVCADEIPVIEAAKFSGGKYAVIVGIDRYANSRINPNLDSCVNDAQSMQNVLIQKCGFSSGNIQVLTNSQATKSNVKNAIHRRQVNFENRLPPPHL